MERYMLEVYRFVLSFAVVQAHLLTSGIASVSWQAVFSFYVLSGFLMTLVLNEVYGFGRRSFLRFCANRILRLYPAYYAVLLLCLVHIVLVGPLNQLNSVQAIPATTAELVPNMFIVGLVGLHEGHVTGARLVPIAWSLSIELVCYALLAAYFAKSSRRLLAMLGVGIAVAGAQVLAALRNPAADYQFADRYMVLQAGLVPFAAGGLAYFARGARLFKPTRAKLCAVLALWALNLGLCFSSELYARIVGLYAAIPLNFLLVPMLYRRETIAGKAPWQRILGGIAYPIFISHWLIGTLVAIYAPGLTPKGLAFFTVSLLSTVSFSLLIYAAIDMNVERWRWQFKRTATRPSAAVAPAAAGR
jgi:peptidoglycan/LPS O-acetylase OafA/YrhL